MRYKRIKSDEIAKKSGQIDVFKLMWSARHLRIQWNELRERIYRIHHSNNLNEKMKMKTSIKWYKNVTFPTDVQWNWIVVHQRIWINFNVFFSHSMYCRISLLYFWKMQNSIHSEQKPATKTLYKRWIA